MLLVVMLGIFSQLGYAWKMPRHIVRNLGASICIATLSNSLNPVYAIDALDAATRAIATAPKERVQTEKNFDDLSEGGKKRKAMRLCKNDVVRKAAGYSSASACTSAVMTGNYAITLSGTILQLGKLSQLIFIVLENFIESKLPQTAPASSSPVRTSPSATSKMEAEIDKSKQLTKKVDLSSLPTASQKRRALAGCKRPEVRKFAKLGSERRCTDSVLQGSFSEVIEALEYIGQ